MAQNKDKVVNLPGEEWRYAIINCRSYASWLTVSSEGRVASYKRQGRGFHLEAEPHILTPKEDKKGYLRVYIVGLRYKLVHKIVAETFLGPLPFKGAEVRHGLKGQKVNSVSNLQYGTRLQNAHDRVPSFTEEDVKAFLHDVLVEGKKASDAEKQFHLHHAYASCILSLQRLGLMKG